MTEAKRTAHEGQQKRSRPAGGGRFLAVLALLFGLIGTAAATYLYYHLVLLDPGADIAGHMAELEAEQSQLRADLRRLASEQNTALKALQAEQLRQQRAAEESLTQMLDGLAVPEPAAEREWRLAEVEYLLRVANHRVLMERDTRTALDLLKAADDLLAGLDDYAMHGVRATLADEILSLEQASVVDVSEIYLHLDTVKRQLGALTLAVPQYTLGKRGDEPPAAAPSQAAATVAATQDEDRIADTGGEESGFLAALVTEFGKLVRFRRIDTDFKPPPVPAEAAYLEINLRLILEQAQLAALKYDQALYASSLDAALEWASAYLDGQNPRVLEMVGTLAELRSQNLETPLPDISGSLNELLQTRRAGR